MNKTLLSISLLLLAINLCKAQEGSVKLSSERKPDHSVDIDFSKPGVGSYFVVINLKELSNCTAPNTQRATVSGYHGRVTTLKPTNPTKGIGYSYSYRYILGKENYKEHNNFVYLLPFKKDTKVKVYESSYLKSSFFGVNTPPTWKCYRFNTEEESTVTAARKGTVVLVKDIYDLDSLKSYAYKQDNNEITIEHADGSFARYSGFKRGSISVKEGQVVYPETVLGLNSKYSAERNTYSLSFMIFYLKSDLFLNNDENKGTSYYGFVTPLIFTKKGETILQPQQEYHADSTPAIVTQEMSKKELKQFKN